MLETTAEDAMVRMQDRFDVYALLAAGACVLGRHTSSQPSPLGLESDHWRTGWVGIVEIDLSLGAPPFILACSKTQPRLDT